MKVRKAAGRLFYRRTDTYPGAVQRVASRTDILTVAETVVDDALLLCSQDSLIMRARSLQIQEPVLNLHGRGAVRAMQIYEYIAACAGCLRSELCLIVSGHKNLQITGDAADGIRRRVHLIELCPLRCRTVLRCSQRALSSSSFVTSLLAGILSIALPIARQSSVSSAEVSVTVLGVSFGILATKDSASSSGTSVPPIVI